MTINDKQGKQDNASKDSLVGNFINLPLFDQIIGFDQSNQSMNYEMSDVYSVSTTTTSRRRGRQAAWILFAVCAAVFCTDVWQINSFGHLEDYFVVGLSSSGSSSTASVIVGNESNDTDGRISHNNKLRVFDDDSDRNNNAASESKKKTMQPHHCIDPEGNNVTLFDKIPTFIVIGTQKGGTTALYEMLKRHPYVVASDKREPHFFDFGYEKHRALIDQYGEAGKCQIRLTYATTHFQGAQKAIQAHPNKLFASFEKTPSLIMHPHLPSLMKQVLPWSKIIVTLRDPVERFFTLSYES
eukprot:scaffold2997_cov182-Amphora_coffeaeformis.AAC.9